MGEIRSTIQLANGMTPALQSITNALNMTISHFEQMQRVSRNSIDVTGFEAARAEIRNAEATIVEMEEALTGFSRSGAEVARSYDDVGLAANGALQTIQQQQNAVAGLTGASENALQQMTEAIQQQTNSILTMSEAMQQFMNRASESSQRQTQQTQRQTEGTRRQTQETQRQTRERQRQTQETQRQTEETERQTQRVTLLRRIFQTMTTPIRGAAHAVSVLGRELTGANSAANGLMGTLKSIAGMYLSFQGIKFAGDLSDNVTSTLSRLNMINDGLRTTQQLSDVIMKSAFESGAGYLDIAEAIAKMGLNAGSAFTSNDELIAFMEQINKTFAIGGASAVEQSNAMVQLSQAMAAGALRGEELNSILDGAPGIARNIEKYMGWAEGSIKSYAEDGKVTAQVVKNAMLAMAEETNEKFNSMPTTISRTFEKIKTLALKSFTPVLQGINGLFNNSNAESILYQWGSVFQYIADRATVTIEKLKTLLNSEQFQAFSSDIMTIFAEAGAAITWVFDNIVNAFDYVVTHWEEVKPVLTGLAVTIGIVTAAQWALNIAMSLNPATLVIVVIGALIVMFYKLVDHINKVKNTSISATGIIAAAFAAIYATAKNSVVGAWNLFADFVNFVYNFSKNKTEAIKVLFFDLGDDILASFQNVIQGLLSVTSHIPKLSFITEGLEKADNFLTRCRNTAQDLSQQAKNNMDWEEFIPRFGYTNVTELVETVYHKIADFGAGFGEYMEDFNPFEGVESMNGLLEGILKNTQNMSKDTSSIKSNMEMDKEDLEFIRTMANIKYGDKYIMPQVKIEMTNNNTIQNNMDLDGFFNKKVEEMANIVQMSAEGVHI